MGAPKGNQFWKLRSKHGRDKLFANAELLYEACCDYFEWCDSNPLLESVHNKLRVNGFGDKISNDTLPKMRPYTLSGLCIYLDCNQVYFNQFENRLKEIDDEDLTQEDKDFSKVITRVREIIFTQKFEGAAAGFLNPNIIARDLGLIDKKDVTSGNKSLQEAQVVLPDGMNLDDYLESKGL